MNNSITFSRLKPLLVNFLSDFSEQNVVEIENAVKELEPESIESLQSFILLPFVTHLKGNFNESITIKCIDFLAFMFTKIQLKAWYFFADIFSTVMFKISNKNDVEKTSSASEELKLSVCKCILNLVCCSSEEILNEMYSYSFRPGLAHTFIVMGSLLLDERSKTLVKTALQTIGALTYNDLYIKKKYKRTELIASEALASCLPGLSVILLKVVTGDDKQAHSVLTTALDILGKLIILTAGDESFERGIANDSSTEIYCFAYKFGKLSKSSETSADDSMPLILKNEAWFKTVAENLEFLIKNITGVSDHSHWKVRYYFLKFSESLIYNCNKTLHNCISILLPLIFGLTVDTHEIVSSSAKTALVSLSEKCEYDSMNSTAINEIVENHIKKLVSQMIRFKLTGNDDKKLTVLKSLLGYIQLSKSNFNKLVVFSHCFLLRVVIPLLNLLKFDVSDLNLIEELPTVEIPDIAHSLWPRKRFKFFRDEEILNIICKLCYSLAQIGNARVLIEYLLEKVSSNDYQTLQSIFIIGNVVKGLANESDVSQKYSNLITEILEVFLSPSLFDVPFSNDDGFYNKAQADLEPTLTHYSLNMNKLQVCLLLEAIANCSECLKADFKNELMTVLCPVMEKAGNSNYIISKCGRLCLLQIVNSCQYTSVQELIKENADYITNLIMINFHGYLDKPETAVVLRVVMEFNDAEAVVLFRDLIFQIIDFLDCNQDKAYPLLHVLLSVVVCINKWFPSEKDSVTNSSNNSNAHKSLKKAIQLYISRRKDSVEETLQNDNDSSRCKNPAEETLQNDNDSGRCKNPVEETVQNDNDSSTEEKKPDVPLHVNIICEIFKRCAYLVSSENRFVRMLTLEIVEICILALRDYRSNSLPLIHIFWKPFLRKFTDDTFVPKAFNVLLLIANEYGDFVHKRTFKEVFPKIVLFLKQEYSKSCVVSFRQYQYTTSHSLQVLLLSEVGNLCTKFDINEKQFHAVATVCLPYLKREQPKILQEAAAKSLKALSVIDSDAVWFYWNVAYSKESSLKPPHESLQTVSFPYCDNSLTSFNVHLENTT